MHLYEVVGSQGGQKLKCHASNKTETLRITSFNDRQEYMSLRGPRQEDSSEYQQPQQCGIGTQKQQKTRKEHQSSREKLKESDMQLYIIIL